MKTTPEARRTLAAITIAAAVSAGCATSGLDDQTGSSGGVASGPISSPAAERVIAGVAQMVLTTRAWATFEEAQADPVVKIEDGAPLFAYIRAVRPLGQLAHPPTPGGNYAFSEYPHLLLQVGEADSLRILGTCYITLTGEEAGLRELVVPLAPLTFRPGQIPADCWLSTVVAARSGQRTYEVRLAGFAGKFESWLPVPDLLAVTPVPTDLSNGAGEYATMLRATPLRSATLLASTSRVSPAALAPAPSNPASANSAPPNPAALSAPAWSLSPPVPSTAPRAGMAGPANVPPAEVTAAAATPTPGPAPGPAPVLAGSSPAPNLMQGEAATAMPSRRWWPAPSDPAPAPASTTPGPIVLDSVPPPVLVTLESVPEVASQPPRAFVPAPASGQYAPAPPPYAAAPAPAAVAAAPMPAPAAVSPMPAPFDPAPMPPAVAATPFPAAPIPAPVAATPLPAPPMPASPMPALVPATPAPAPFEWNPVPASVVREPVPAPAGFGTAPNPSRSNPSPGARSPFVPASPSPEGPGFPTLATVAPTLLGSPPRKSSLVASSPPLPGPRQDIGSSRMQLQLQSLAAALLGRRPSEAFFMDGQWTSSTDPRGRVWQQHAHAAAIFKGASCSWQRLKAFRRPGANGLLDVEPAGEPIEINCSDLK